MSLLGKILSGGKGGSSDSSLYTPRFGYSADGQYIDQHTALKVSSWYAAHRVLSTQFAKAPLKLYKRTGDSGRVEADTKELRRLMLVRPNAQQNSYVFKQFSFSNKFFNGNNYAFKDFDAPEPSLIPLDPARVEPKQKLSGELYYKYRYANGETDDFRRDQIFHSIGFTLDGLVGVSLITYAATQIGLQNKQADFQAHQLDNRATPAGSMEVPGTMSVEAKKKFREDYEALYSGAENAGRLMVLDGGKKYTPLTQMSNVDMEFLADKRFSVQDTSRFTGVPPALLFDNSESTWNNSVEANRMFLEYGLDPWLVSYEMACNTQLLSPREQERFFFEFDRSAFYAMDAEKMSIALLNGRYGGWVNADEARSKFNMSPMPGDLGKTFWRPENMAPADAPYEPNNPTKNNQKTAENGKKQGKTEIKAEISSEKPAPPVVTPKQLESYGDLLTQVFRRMSTKALTHREKLDRKHSATGDTSEAFSQWLSDNKQMFEDELRPALAVVMAGFGREHFDVNLSQWAELVELGQAAEAVAGQMSSSVLVGLMKAFSGGEESNGKI